MSNVEKSDDRERMLREGKWLFALIGDQLNELGKNRPLYSYRREEDFEEICIALALLAGAMGIMEGVNNT